MEGMEGDCENIFQTTTSQSPEESKSSDETEDGVLHKVKRIVHAYPDKAVEVMLKGISTTYPGLTVDIPTRIIYLKKNRGAKVAIVTGGGSGHEPFGAGFIGNGMATACIAGAMFTSPSSRSVLTGILKASELNKGGVLLAHLNYTGDVINFGIAAEEAKARKVKVESVVIGDDVSTLSKDSIAGRRGVSGGLFILKVAGAMSEAGKSLQEITAVCIKMAGRIASMGACLSPGSIPGHPPQFYIGPNAIHLGVGIHGEAGVKAIKGLPTAEYIVKIILDKIDDHLKLPNGSSVCVIVNNLGSMTPMETSIIVAEVQNYLDEKKIRLERMYSGSLVTSLDMNGFIVSILDSSSNQQWVEYLDAETDAFAWPGTRLSAALQSQPPTPLKLLERSEQASANSVKLDEDGKKTAEKVVKAVCEALLKEEERLNQLDAGAGDGDTGSTLAAFAKGLQKDWKGELGKVSSIGELLLGMSKAAERDMGGTSGGLYSLLLLGAARNSSSFKTIPSGAIFLLQNYTSARVGDRTMLDALIPAAKTFEETYERRKGDWKAALRAAVTAAQEGAASTKSMAARAGRASYVNKSHLTQVDAGAHAVVIWLDAIATALDV